MDNRVVALSVLEDLLFWPLPPRDGVVAPPDDSEAFEDLDEDALAMARLAAEENSLEPRAVREARYRAVLQLPLLAAKLGPRWTRAEVVPFLLRCLEEEDAPLAFAVGVVVLGLVRPHVMTDAERDRLAKEKETPSGAPSPTNDGVASRTYAFVDLAAVMPVIERLGACREERLRAFTAQVVVPHVCLGVPLELGSVMEGWDRKYLCPVHIMQSLEDQQAGAVGAGGADEEEDGGAGEGLRADVAATLEASAANTHGGGRAKTGGASASSSQVRRVADSGAVDPRQRVLRPLRDVMEHYRQRADALTETKTAVSSSSRLSSSAQWWTPLDYVYQRLGMRTTAPTSGKTLVDDNMYEALFALEAVRLDIAEDAQLNFLTPYLDRLSDAGVVTGMSTDVRRRAATGSAATRGQDNLLLLNKAPLGMLGISYASDSFGTSESISGSSGSSATRAGRSQQAQQHGSTAAAAADPFTLNVRARALTSEIVNWFGLVTDSTTAERDCLRGSDYLDASVEVRQTLGSRWQTLTAVLQRLLGSSWPGAVAVGVEAIASLLHALTRALGFCRRTAAHNAASKRGKAASAAADVAVVAPPAVALRFAHDAQVFHVLTTQLHLAFCATAAVEVGVVESTTTTSTAKPPLAASEDVWLRLSRALPVAINALYTQLYAHRVFLLTPIQLCTSQRAGSDTPLAGADCAGENTVSDWLVQFGPGPLEARLPMLATWDVAFATRTRTGQPDDIAVLLLRDEEEEAGEGGEGALSSRPPPRRPHTKNHHADPDAIALSAKTEACWRRGVAGIASSFGLHHVLRLCLVRCLPLLIVMEPCFGVDQGEAAHTAKGTAAVPQSRPRGGNTDALDETPAATLDTVVRLLAQVIAPPGALPQLLSELLRTTMVMTGEHSSNSSAVGVGASGREGRARGVSPATTPRARSASGMHRSRRGSYFSPTASLSVELPPASPRGTRASAAVAGTRTSDLPGTVNSLLWEVSPVDALALSDSTRSTPNTAETSQVGESPASVDYSLLEVVVASVEKTFTRAAVLITSELGSYTDAVVSGRLSATTSATAVAERVEASVRLLFLLYQACVRYIMVRAAWKARWLLSKRLPSLTAGFLYVLVCLAHIAASPSRPAATDAEPSAAVRALRGALQRIATAYLGYTSDLLTKAWSGHRTDAAGALVSLLSDDEAEVCYLSTHCLGGVLGELTQAAFRTADSIARGQAHARCGARQVSSSSSSPPAPSHLSAPSAADKAEQETRRVEYAAALGPLLVPLRTLADVVVEGCRLNLTDPLPRVRCGAVKGLALLSGVLSHVVAVTRFYAPYMPSPTDRKTPSAAAAAADNEGEGGTDGLAQQYWADALTRTTQTLLSAMNDTSSVVQLALVSELSHLLVRQGSEERGPQDGSGGAETEASQQVRREALLKCLRGLARHDIWRYRERYAVLLAEMCFCFLTASSDSLQKLVKEELLQLLVNTLFDKVKAVRDAALAATTKLCARMYAIAVSGSVAPTPASNDFVNSTLWPVIYETPRAMETYLSRNALLQVALCLGVDKKGTMLPLLQKLAKDAVINVRLVVAKTVLQILLSDRIGESSSRERSSALVRGPSTSAAAGASTYELLMGKPLLYNMIRRVGPSTDGARRPVAAAAAAATTGRADGDASGGGPTSISGGAGGGALALPLITFTTEEKNGVVLELLRQLLEDPSRDVRDEAAKALHICF